MACACAAGTDGALEMCRAVRDAKKLAPGHHDEIHQVESKCVAQLTALKDDHHKCSSDSTKCGKDGFDIGVGKIRDDCDFRNDLSDLDGDSSVLMQRRALGGESPKQQQSSSRMLSRDELMQLQSEQLSTSLTGKKTC